MNRLILKSDINRDARGLACTQYCQETPDGGMDLVADEFRYELAPEQIADGPAFAATVWALRDKRWFTPEVLCDLTYVATARWLAKARGWV